MKIILYALGLATLLAGCQSNTAEKNESEQPMAAESTQANSTSDEGWISLFDGKTTQGWHTYGKNSLGKAWKVVDGQLYLDASKKEGDDWQVAEGGDIVTEQAFGDFHLQLEWKISENGNSGIMFYVQEDTSRYEYPWQTGPEMQVLHNEGHPDGKIVKHRVGDLYDLITAKEGAVKPVGEWNKAEIISDKGQLTFRLNGQQVVQTTLWDDHWRALIAGSKFADMPGFGTFKEGKIALQDHGDDVWYRNIRIKRL